MKIQHSHDKKYTPRIAEGETGNRIETIAKWDSTINAHVN
jgi:hypothetical protein